MDNTATPSPLKPRSIKKKQYLSNLVPRYSVTQNTESVNSGSENPAAPSTGLLSSNPPQFDVESTFPAILAPVKLLREVEDLDSLRALTPIFSQCLAAILHSIAQFHSDVGYTSALQLAESAVEFSKQSFLGHINQLHVSGFQPTSKRAFIGEAIELMDITMSTLTVFMRAAEREWQQMKPLPDPPEECEEILEAEEDGDQSIGAGQSYLPSTDNHQSSEGSSTCVEEVDELGALVKAPPIKRPKRGLAAIIGPIKTLRRKCSRISFSKADTATPVEKITTRAGHARATANIRNSIALFTELLDGKLEHSLPHPDDSTELFMDRNGVLQLASLRGLIRYLTSTVSDDDLELADVFFLCFRYFSTPALVLEAFMERYKEKLPGCLSPDQVRTQSLHVKMRVARLLNQWVDLHWRHSDDHEVFATLTQFAFSDLSQDLPRDVSSKLINTLHNAACAKEHKGRRLEKTVQLIQASSPAEEFSGFWEPREKEAMVGEVSKIWLTRFSSPQRMELLTHQLTLVLWEKYRVFQPEDAARFWVEEATGKTPYGISNDAGPKVTTYASFEKAIHLWALDIIVSPSSMEARIKNVKFVLEWAQACHKIRNYAASWALFSACDRQSLVGTSLNIGAKHDEILLGLRLFFSHTNHMKAYKDAIQSSLGPTLPTLVLFVGDVKRQCGNEERVENPNAPGHKLINLRRYRPLTRAVRDMERCHTPYHIQRVDSVYQWIEEVICCYLKRPEAEWEDILYEKSRRLKKNSRF
ncbi:ras guanine nucleotide exchange factor domain-containing protein [Suillus paluster]|uniref:ras guanine nucleotide exchange factor domain-containing protein n=1 Tax=Suillus paluster TaxID=48578 RepID=UPI001B86A1EB|nr:ras guanine nucleotide exchange factor domain-containing protein [Suillus paluster]KAG1746001.1 ras guanine nucleotide exchange factor domain-containing protein [Suillus paluster]